MRERDGSVGGGGGGAGGGGGDWRLVRVVVDGSGGARESPPLLLHVHAHPLHLAPLRNGALHTSTHTFPAI